MVVSFFYFSYYLGIVVYHFQFESIGSHPLFATTPTRRLISFSRLVRALSPGFRVFIGSCPGSVPSEGPFFKSTLAEIYFTIYTHVCNR